MPGSGLDVHELAYIDRFIVGVLGADVVTQALLETTAAEQAADIFRVWGEIMPEGAPYPGILLSWQTGQDTTAIGAIRVMTRVNYLVRAVAVGDSYQQAGDIATAMGRALEGASGKIDQVKIGGIYRLSPFRLHQVRAGVRYNFVGGFYRIIVSK